MREGAAGLGIGAVGEDATALIRNLAERQHGAVARRQLLEAGLGKGLVQERVRTGLLAPVHRGVYAVGHRRNDLRHRWMAAVLACGRRARLSHRSAGHLWDLRGSRGVVQVTRLSPARPRPGILVMQAVSLSVDEVTVEAGIPVTTVERTIIDLAAELDRSQLTHVLVAADRSRKLSWARLTEILEDGPRRVGAAVLKKAIEEADPGDVEARSGLEIDFLGLCRRSELPVPAANVLVEGYLVDFLWPTERVIVEVDSFLYHHDRPAFERDHRATVELETAGYRVHRIADQMLQTDPGPFIELVRSSLGAS